MAFYDYEGMKAAGKQVSTEAANLEGLINTVTNIVNNLSSSWTDVAQTKFASQWNEVVPKFKAFVPELEAYSKAIIAHAIKAEDLGNTL